MPKEAAWAIGFIAGAAVTSVGLGALGVGGVLRLVLVLGCGVGAGVLAEMLARERDRPL